MSWSVGRAAAQIGVTVGSWRDQQVASEQSTKEGRILRTGVRVQA